MKRFLLPLMLALSLLTACHDDDHDHDDHDHGSDAEGDGHDHDGHQHDDTAEGDSHDHETHSHDVSVDTGGEASQEVIDLCRCLLFSCHDRFHEKYGVSDEDATAACQMEAAALPLAGEDVSEGDFLECRINQCAAASSDATTCAAALGAAPCQ